MLTCKIWESTLQTFSALDEHKWFGPRPIYSVTLLAQQLITLAPNKVFDQVPIREAESQLKLSGFSPPASLQLYYYQLDSLHEPIALLA